MTDLKTLRQLVKLMVDNDLTELDIEGEDGKIRLKRGGDEVKPVAPALLPAPPVAPVPSPAEPASTPVEAEAAGTTIDSPMVGTFYAAASPDAQPFVSVGDAVGPDTVICVIEAMKVFNEIKAERSGTIVRLMVNNGDAVEFGQPLFEIEPA